MLLDGTKTPSPDKQVGSQSILLNPDLCKKREECAAEEAATDAFFAAMRTKRIARRGVQVPIQQEQAHERIAHES